MFALPSFINSFYENMSKYFHIYWHMYQKKISFKIQVNRATTLSAMWNLNLNFLDSFVSITIAGAARYATAKLFLEYFDFCMAEKQP